MSNESQERLRQAQQRRETRDSLRQERVATQDQLKGDAYRAQYLQTYLAEMNAEIERAENPGFLRSLFGSRLDKAERLRSEQYEIKQQTDELTAAVDAMQRRLTEIEGQLEALADIDNEYATALREAEQSMVQGDGEAASRFSSVAAQFEQVQERVRSITRATEAGEFVLQRLSTMSKSLNRSRRKHIHGVAIVSTVWNVVQDQTAGPSVDRALEGLEDFARRLREVDVGAGTELDLEINRHVGDIEQRCAQLAGGWTQAAAHDSKATFPVEDEVRAVLNLLELKQDLEHRELARLEQEKNAFLAGA